ncbi:MAG: peptidoglycan DD-metalloendopeptidase family protein [Pseudohongiella sp.]|nr:peptidoglycan DD-metalloendopeptidase family protein [Pseudohongiella sp.]MDO9521684.1 peptidoglycan DD-metalloendopeptidase family protein [Pseudohongiella sp.]MDP2128275.1 peptidoglycan DD-metalloendopeptidase family protein [Pseudohongiella sp.]
MDPISTARHIFKQYYPRNHLMLASALSAGLVLVAMLAPEESAHGDRLRSEINGLVGNIDELRATSGISGERSATQQIMENVAKAAHEAALQNAERAFVTQVTVRQGDTLSSLFSQVGLSAQSLSRVINSSDESTVLNRLFPGNKLSFYVPEPGQLKRLEVFTSPLEGFVFTLNESRYDVEPIIRTPEIVQVVREGRIADSLFLAGQRAEIPANVIMSMADVFGGVIDFLLDPRQGDEFSIIYEEKYLDGQFVGTGQILAAQFINQGREHAAVRYETSAGEAGFFSPDGESMTKAFLKNPLDVFRISSNFNPNRMHPILNTIRAHRGTDYAAPTGTPVRATADGTVTWAARNGSYGKLIVIEHQGSFETKYAHLNDYASGIKKGSRVRQGEIIGYVGATGGATGPHLHYEFLVGGVHKDPRTIVDQLPLAIALDDTEMVRFRKHSQEILRQLTKNRPDSRLLSYNSYPISTQQL